MSWGAVIVGGAALVGSYMNSEAQEDAAETAAAAQTQGADQGVAEQRRQFDLIQSLLKPYVEAGNSGLAGQRDLLGLNGADAQGAAIKALEGSPTFGALMQQGENAILQNASATGGLRGGNTQHALAQFRPQLLAQLIDDQYSKLGGLTTMGQNSAVMTGSAGQNAGNTIAQLLQQSGAAQAGAALAGGRANAGLTNGVVGAIGSFGGAGGFNRLFGGASGGGAGATDWGYGSMPAGTF